MTNPDNRRFLAVLYAENLRASIKKAYEAEYLKIVTEKTKATEKAKAEKLAEETVDALFSVFYAKPEDRKKLEENLRIIIEYLGGEFHHIDNTTDKKYEFISQKSGHSMIDGESCIVVCKGEGEGPFVKRKERNDMDGVFYICYYKTLNYFNVLVEVGHAMLDYQYMLDSIVKTDGIAIKFCCGVDDFDGSVRLFARSFAMPRRDFEKKVLEFNRSIDEVARHFNIDYIQARQRGLELGCLV